MSNEDKIKRFMRALFGDEINEEKLNEKTDELRNLAFEEWVDWLSGSYRPTSISENTSDRIFKIYTHIKSDIPKIEELVNYFNIPSGRAKYIVSALKYGGYPKIKEIVRRKLKEILEKEIKEKSDEENITPFIEKALLDELDFIEHEIAHKDKNPNYGMYEQLRGRRSFGLECMMRVRSAKLIIEKLNSLLSTV